MWKKGQYYRSHWRDWRQQYICRSTSRRSTTLCRHGMLVKVICISTWQHSTELLQNGEHQVHCFPDTLTAKHCWTLTGWHKLQSCLQVDATTTSSDCLWDGFVFTFKSTSASSWISTHAVRTDAGSRDRDPGRWVDLICSITCDLWQGMLLDYLGGKIMSLPGENFVDFSSIWEELASDLHNEFRLVIGSDLGSSVTVQPSYVALGELLVFLYCAALL